MSFDDLLIHSLTVKRMTPILDELDEGLDLDEGVTLDGTPDEYGQPTSAEVTVATVKGLIQPRRAREVALASQAGAAIGEHVAYLRPLSGLTTANWIEAGGVRYDIVSVGDAAGQGHHLELGLRRVD